MIATENFGRTGHLSTRTVFGAAALRSVAQEQADRTLELLLSYGVNHIDTAAAYGESEDRIGAWMSEYRDRFFLATKTGQRRYADARLEIRRSLDRLQTDHVDLLQLHNLVDPEEWRLAMGPRGALEAALEARDEGLVRFIGVTGHGTAVAAMHLLSLERFPFDSVLLPYTIGMMQNPDYARDFEALLEECEGRGVAVQTIKSIARRPWGERERTATTWYQPLSDPDDIRRAVHWVLGRPGVFLNTVGDVGLLPPVLEAAACFEGVVPPVEAMMELQEASAMQPLFLPDAPTVIEHR